jgi:hypothetical protein
VECYFQYHEKVDGREFKDNDPKVDVDCDAAAKTVIGRADSGLAENTEYEVRYVVVPAAKNGQPDYAGKGESDPKTYRTAPSPTVVQPAQLSGTAGETTATVYGCVDTYGADSDVIFDWAEGDSSGKPDWDNAKPYDGAVVGSCSGGVRYQVDRSDLKGYTQYFVRLRVHNQTDAAGVSYPADPSVSSFKTLPVFPVVSTSSINFPSATSAVVVGDLTAHNPPQTRVWFEYGTAPDQLNDSTAIQSGVGSGVSVVSNLENLQPGTSYWYRIAAQAYDDKPIGPKVVGGVYSLTTLSAGPPFQPQNPFPPGSGQNPTPPGHSTQSNRSKLTIAAKTVKIARKQNSFTVKASCAKVRACKGTLTATIKQKTKTKKKTRTKKHTKSKTKTRTVTLAKGKYTIAAGKTTKIKLKLTARGKQELRKHKTVKTTLTAKGEGATTLTQTLTLQRGGPQ